MLRALPATAAEWGLPPSLQPLRVPAPAWPGLQLWRVDLAAHAALAPASALSPAEQARLARFRFERDARRWRAARHALRSLIAAARAQALADTLLRDDAWGKPHCADGGAPQFNLSHSGDWALVVLHPHWGLGIDLEVPAPPPDDRQWRELAPSVLSATEQQALQALPEREREAAFLRAWTRKEACLKAPGWGLRVEPVLLSVGVAHEAVECELGAHHPEPQAQAGSVRVEVCSLASPLGAQAPGAEAAVARVQPPLG